MRDKSLKLITTFLVLLFLISIFSYSTTVTSKNEIFQINIKKDNLKISKFWDLTGSPILIDNNDPSKNWSYTALHYDWCSGSGNWTDPYIIENVTIDGQSSSRCIEIRGSDAYFIIRNCTFYNSGSNSHDTGIFLNNVDNGKIINNTCSDNDNYGIYLRFSNNNTLSGNTASNNNNYGIYLYYSNKNTLSGNTADNNNHGIYLFYSNNNTLSGNTASNNDNYGIYLYHSKNSIHWGNIASNNNNYGIRLEYSNNNTISGNTANNNKYGIYLSHSDNSTISGNTASNNDNVGIYSNYNINSTISENTANNNSIGIFLRYSDNSTISGNNIYNNTSRGIYLYDSNNNTLSGNTANNNTIGIFFKRSNNNTLSGNTASSNNENGIYLWGNSNLFSGNRIRDNKYYGTYITGGIISTQNLFFNNSFLNNMVNVYDGGINNYWNNSVIGNYWDDYNGEDSNNDGIGDTPYNISGFANSQDNYPIWWDFIDISINTPNPNEFFGTIAPSFTISIDKGLARITWYTIDNGLTNITFTGYTGTVDQTEWDKISSDFVTLTFYANNTLGVISSSEVIIVKDIANPIIIINSPKPNDLIGVITPSFNIEVTEANLDTIWYTIDGGITNTTFITNGTINQELWDALSNGTATITFYVNDSAGNEVFNSVTVRVDKIIPSIIIHSPIENQLFGANVPSPKFNISVDDIFHDKMWYTLNQDSIKYFFVSPWDYINQTAWSGLPDGSVKMRFYANDSAGNIGFSEVIIKKDVTTPIITINNPQNNDIIGTTAPSFDISIDELNLDKVWYSLNGGINITFTGLTGTINQALWNALPERNVVIKFYANDTLGKIGSAGVTIKKDVVDPIITINNPQNNNVIGTTAPSFNISINEQNLDTVWYSLNGGTNMTFTGLTGIINQALWDALPEGNVVIKFYANDTSGKIGFSEVTIKKDVTTPIISINNPQNNVVIGATAPNFNITIDEPNLDKVWYSLNGGIDTTFTELTGTVDQTLWDALPEGNITIRFYVNDLAGNIGFQEVTVIKKITQPSAFGIPGYDLLFLLGIISAVTIIIIKKRLNHLD